MRRLYDTTNSFVVHKLDFFNFSASRIKSQREDFNDMFVAENNFRVNRGDYSLVFCLTYNDEHLRKYCGHNMLDSDDLKVYAKSSKWSKMLERVYGFTFDFVAVGEFGNGGESHNFRGSRGKFENPHFHCVGWFHRVHKPDEHLEEKLVNSPLEFLSEYERLCWLVRDAWQCSSHDNIEAYARDVFSRRLGLGFVKLDGPVRSSFSGGSYIGKYIGKDIARLSRECFRDCFVGHVDSILKDFVRERGLHDDLIGLWVNYRSNFPLDSLLKADWIRYKEYVHYPIRRLYRDVYSSFFEDFVVMDNLYLSAWSEFQSYMSGRYSPKVRKFHGFGYSLLGDADLEAGTYTVNRKSGVVCRSLPPSLARYAYYNHYVTTNTQGEKIVKYILNDLGLRKLGCCLRSSVNMDVLKASIKGSEQLKMLSRTAAIWLNCCSTYDVKRDAWHLVEPELRSIVENCDVDAAIRYACACRSTSVYEFSETLSEAGVSVVDVNNWLRDNYLDLYIAVDELKNIRLEILGAKDAKDREYNEHWLNVFNFNS